jgi:Ohr subfamily peroxiredoxin
MTLTVLFTAHATSTGGRNGRTCSDDGLLDVQLSVPKALGGPGRAGATTPEDLFAAGYAACFGSACEFMGTQLKLKPSSVEIKAAAGHSVCPYSNAVRGDVEVGITVRTA